MMAPGFTGGTLLRDDRVRHDPALLAAALADPQARRLLLDGLDPRLDDADRLVWADRGGAERPLVFLGFDGDVPCFAETLPPGLPLPPGRTPELSAMLDRFHAPDAALYAAARSLLIWHARNRFCANCGHGSDLFRAGWGRLCPNCATEHYPRVEPVVIMIAEHGGRALLGRQPSWPEGRYSALAGFLEVGESIEEAVAREVLEEAGVRVTGVRYVASQPWPFPSSLMIACIGTAESDALTLDTHELEDARWFTRDAVRRALAGDPDAGFLVPPPYAIAHTLLRHWADGEDAAA